MTFLISLLIMLRKIMCLKALGKLYDSLLGLGMIMKVETLKYVSQLPSSKHVSAILIIFFKYILLIIILLRYLYNNLSGLEVHELLYLLIELINYASENKYYVIVYFFLILSNKLVSI